MGVGRNGAFKLGLYANLNVQSSLQEWVDETKRIFFLRTTNNVRNNISNCTTPLWVGNLRHDPSEDLRSSNYHSLYNLRERGPSNSIVNRHLDTDLAKHRVIYQSAHAVPAPFSVVNNGRRDVLMEFAPFFEDPSIKKVWHNYSFDSHIIENCGIKVAGFHADTMHLVRLWDSFRRTDGGYSLEGLTNDHRVMDAVLNDLPKTEKMSIKTIFGRKKG